MVIVLADILDDVIDNVYKINGDLSKEEIRDILTKGIDKKAFKKHYTQYQKEDPKQLKSEVRQDNSLTIFDEYLIRFEVECSENLGKFCTVKDLVDEFGMDKILTDIHLFYTFR